MDEHSADNGTEDIETAVEGITGKSAVEGHAVEDKAQDYHGYSGEDRIEHHRLEIPLQTLPRFRADAGNGNTDELHHLAGSHGVEDLEAVEHIEDEGNHGVGGRDRQVHHDLYNQYQVDARAEHIVHLLLFTGFFHIYQELENLRMALTEVYFSRTTDLFFSQISQMAWIFLSVEICEICVTFLTADVFISHRFHR